VERCLAGVSHIIHAGDIGAPGVVENLRRIAPVTAIKGNVDKGEWAKRYPDTETVRLAGNMLPHLARPQGAEGKPFPTRN
jgi:predicted phosphodiesterase